MAEQAFATYDDAADFAGPGGTIERRGMVWVGNRPDDVIVADDSPPDEPAEPEWKTSVENLNDNTFIHGEP